MQVTRQKIIDMLRAHGQATVDELATEVSLTPMAVRHHLNVLQADGLVLILRTKQRHRPGRPIQVYGLTNKARKLYPQQYLQLTDLLVEEMTERIGQEAVDDVFKGIADRLVAEVPPLAEDAPLAARFETLVTFLKEKGFVAEWTLENGEYTLCHYDCPYRQFAQNHNTVCMLDERLITAIIGSAPIRQLSIAQHQELCKYVFPNLTPPDKISPAV